MSISKWFGKQPQGSISLPAGTSINQQTIQQAQQWNQWNNSKVQIQTQHGPGEPWQNVSTWIPTPLYSPATGRAVVPDYNNNLNWITNRTFPSGGLLHPVIVYDFKEQRYFHAQVADASGVNKVLLEESTPNFAGKFSRWVSGEGKVRWNREHVTMTSFSAYGSTDHFESPFLDSSYEAYIAALVTAE